VFAYVTEGEMSFSEDAAPVGRERTVLFGPGEQVVMEARAGAARLLLVSGRPLREPVAWGGPIVMNTQEELRRAMQEYRDGTFVRDPAMRAGYRPGP
jgi:redox-sensitive bicupin YhaK (pirin superfamily)